MPKKCGVKRLRSDSSLGITKWCIAQDRPAPRDENGNIMLKASGGVHMIVACAANTCYDGNEFVVDLIKSGKGLMSFAHHKVGTVHAITGLTKCVCREGRFEFNLVVWAESMLENDSSFYLRVRTHSFDSIVTCTDSFKIVRHTVKALTMEAARQMYKPAAGHSNLHMLASVVSLAERIM